MNTRKSLLALSLLAASALAHAGDYSFGNVSFNQLNWSDSTLDKTQAAPFGAKRNFQYLEAEGGMGRSWGDLYGFFDLENWNRNDTEMPAGDRRYTTKVVARFNITDIGGVPVKLYTHVYDTRGHNFFDQNRVLGLGTDLSFGRVWFKPFLGMHQELKWQEGAHRNGWMAGYVAGFDFNAFGQPFSMTQWHETEFDRNENHFTTVAQPGGTVQKRTGQNGAVALWWNPTKSFTAGVQYRYAINKLGVAGNENAMIYSAKYNF
ncbi:outer membrane protein OmpK [Chromobacterium vaccinii]|uniref:outer membrane protein OmpK n=1 Tax=Chromobacterium vaccinii TaxID=1108595 RepID=UPI000E1846DE|nr:outer membrane protein OmpK [Chromobacterium vaccinii]SUX29481.1 Nucleoside-specific channel-forming protein, Tsx [Chromobacterium vaccinii]